MLNANTFDVNTKNTNLNTVHKQFIAKECIRKAMYSDCEILFCLALSIAPSIRKNCLFTQYLNFKCFITLLL